jgi:hypothetical protein
MWPVPGPARGVGTDRLQQPGRGQLLGDTLTVAAVTERTKRPRRERTRRQQTDPPQPHLDRRGQTRIGRPQLKAGERPMECRGCRRRGSPGGTLTVLPSIRHVRSTGRRPAETRQPRGGTGPPAAHGPAGDRQSARPPAARRAAALAVVERAATSGRGHRRRGTGGRPNSPECRRAAVTTQPGRCAVPRCSPSVIA